MKSDRAYRPGSFPVSTFSRSIVASVLRAGRGNLLVHGVPGTGKTTFVATMLRELGLPAFFLSIIDGNKNSQPAFLRIGVAAHAARNAGAVLVIDEADTLFNTEAMGSVGDRLAKAWITEFMDSQDGMTVWIANEIGAVHDAVKRRFLYSLEFGAQSETQRIMLWNELVRGYGLESSVGAQEIRAFAKRHDVNAGGIDVALRGLRGYLNDGGCAAPALSCAGPGGPVAVLSEFLVRHEALMTGFRRSGRRNAGGENSRYLPDAINVDIPLDDLVSALSTVAGGIRERHEREALSGGGWESSGAGSPSEVLEAKLLFAGDPGTGKTAFARYLAEALELPLVQRRASELLGSLVGDTEKLIAAAFEEAENQGAILLLDEADSLFIDRRLAVRNWERSQTNELLTQMEDYSGILVCCTNRREDFDPAAMRRFQWKVTFSSPRPDQRVELYRRYFTELCGAPDDQVTGELGRMDGLCPGDFAAVHKALVPLGAGREARLPFTHERVLQRLCAELSCRPRTAGRVIGFAE